MAACERGYLCAVCGGDVEAIGESDLYLRYVLGEVAFEELGRLPERHIRCDPVLAQFIVSQSFSPVLAVAGPFSKEELDPEFVAREEARVTLAFLRLQELSETETSIRDYPMKT